MIDVQKQLERIAQYPEEIKEDVVYIAQILDERYNGNKSALAADLKSVRLERSVNWFTQLLGGYYVKKGVFTADIAVVSAMARALRDIASGNAARGVIPFTETDTVRLIRASIDAVRFRGNVCKWVMIVGATGTQKTESVENYADTHDNCIYTEAPQAPSAPELIKRLARAGKCPSNMNKCEFLEKKLNEDSVVIIDNAQRMHAQAKGLTQPAFSYLQMLQDLTKCVIVLVFVDEATGEDSLSRIMLGKDKGFFEQLIGRAGGIERVVRTPNMPSESDFIAFAKSAGFKDANMRRAIVPILKGLTKRDGKIRIALNALQDAARLAFARKREVIVDDFIEVLPLETFNDKQILYIDQLKQKAIQCA